MYNSEAHKVKIYRNSNTELHAEVLRIPLAHTDYRAYDASKPYNQCYSLHDTQQIFNRIYKLKDILPEVINRRNFKDRFTPLGLLLHNAHNFKNSKHAVADIVSILLQLGANLESATQTLCQQNAFVLIVKQRDILPLIADVMIGSEYFKKHEMRKKQQSSITAKDVSNASILLIKSIYIIYNSHLNDNVKCCTNLAKILLKKKDYLFERTILHHLSNYHDIGRVKIYNILPIVQYIAHFSKSKNDFPLESQDILGATPLISAARAGDLGMVNALLVSGANVNAIDYTGKTAIMWVAQEGNGVNFLEVFTQLFKNGAEINETLLGYLEQNPSMKIWTTLVKTRMEAQQKAAPEKLER